jgi:NhaP-type Na+/H+ or K+/H+ antiporter
MLGNRRYAWIPVIAATAPIAFGIYRVAPQAIRGEATLGELIGEALGAIILAVLIAWLVQLTMSLGQKGHWLALSVLCAITCAVAALIYLPQSGILTAGIILAGFCQLILAAYVLITRKPKIAKAAVCRNRN